MLNLNEVKNAELKQRTKLKELIKTTDYEVAFSKNDYARTDGFIISQNLEERYTIETKWYGDKDNIRDSTKFQDYMIDYSKLQSLTDNAIKNQSKPLLMCFFSNELVVWDISKCNWQSTGKWKWVNKEGQNYGKEKEYCFMAFLLLDDAIYRNKNITPFN